MGRIGTGLIGLVAGLLLLAGCKHDNTLKPPPEDPVYRLPPNDPRYSSYPKFPEDTLNKFPKRVAIDPDDPTPVKGPPRFGGSGPGASGPGF
jgi:hypothetical protein